MFNKFIGVVEGLRVYPENMLANLVRTRGLIFSQRVLLELMNRGLTRTKAYDLVQRSAMQSWIDGADFKGLLLKERNVRQHLSSKDLDKIFDLDYYLRHVNRIFRRLGL